MINFYRPPTRDEMQYASDVIRGKRKLDAGIIIGTAFLGALMGIAIGFAGADASNEPPNASHIAISAGVCALTLGVIAALILGSIRSIMAVCKAWLPARIIAIVACFLLGVQILRKIAFWIILPSQALADLVLSCLILVFAILFFNLGLRLVFIVYCMITGQDEDEIMVRNISANNKKQ